MTFVDIFHPAYSLEVRVDLPSSAAEAVRLTCKACVEHPAGNRFQLNQSLKIEQILVGGEPVQFRRDPSVSVIGGVDTAVIVEAEAVDDLVVTYGGTLPAGSMPEMVERVTKLTPDLVELAVYGVWYPLFADAELLTFQMKVDLPKDFTAVTNGILEAEEAGKGRRVSHWRSPDPGFDIVLIASPRLQKLEDVQDGLRVEVCYDRLPSDYVMAMKEKLIWGLRRFGELYGPLKSQGLLRFVYAPRSGWGYSRRLAIVVGEESALGQLDQPFGPASDYRYAAHEMAHFWWSIADARTADDWINEGLAEFSAYRVSRELLGQAFADHRADEYRYNAAHCKTQTPIAETTAESPDREVNRYDKAALLFIEAQERFGSEPLDGFLRALFSRFQGTTGSTTALFLEEVERQMGMEAHAFFKEEVYR
jgi:hypothetical protein